MAQLRRRCSHPEIFPYFATPNVELQTVAESVELAAPAEEVWSLIGQFNIDWHPLVARVRLTGSGSGQLRAIQTVDGKEIVERLEEIDHEKRFYRYTLVAGIAASPYTGVLEVKRQGNGTRSRCLATWRVDFLASNQPAIVVRDQISRLLRTGLEGLRARFALAAGTK